MNPAQQKHLRQRLEDGTDQERELNDMLVATIGGELLVLPPADAKPADWESQESRSWWLHLMLTRGSVMDSPVTLRRKAVSRSELNVAKIWRKHQYGIAAIGSGFALNEDGLWREHTWGLLRDGDILETTVKREKYFGLALVGDMADDFAESLLGPDRAERKTLTNKQKAQELFDYMEFRAGRENLKHELTPQFYRMHIDSGCMTFFGVEVGLHGLRCDAQQPEIFTEWKDQRFQQLLREEEDQYPTSC